MATRTAAAPPARHPTWLLGLLPLLIVATAIGAFAALGGPGLGERRGPPTEGLVVEQAKLTPGVIAVTVRNDGARRGAHRPGPGQRRLRRLRGGATSAVGRLATETVRIPYPWVAGEAYSVVLITSTGGTIAHEIPIAVGSPERDLSFFGLMALLGIYVGVIPIALGMLWLPWMRRIPRAWMRVDHGRHRRPAGVPGHRCGAGRARPRRDRQPRRSVDPRSCSSVRSSAYLALTGVGPWMSDRRARARGGREPRDAGPAGRDGHRAAQSRRRRDHRIGLRATDRSPSACFS